MKINVFYLMQEGEGGALAKRNRRERRFDVVGSSLIF